MARKFFFKKMRTEMKNKTYEKLQLKDKIEKKNTFIKGIRTK